MVDDHATNRKIVHHYIISWGMRNGMAARTGSADVLRKAAAQNDPYQIAVIDFQMPEMDGVTLAQRIKADLLR